jgi:hypothetical protein
MDGLAPVSFPFPHPLKSVLLGAVVPLGIAPPHLVVGTPRNRLATAAWEAMVSSPASAMGLEARVGWAVLPGWAKS